MYIDYVEIFNVSPDFSTVYLHVLMGVELPLCVVATSEIVLFYFTVGLCLHLLIILLPST